MVIKGRVHKFGDDINTDDIIAAKYLVTTDEKELGRHCMENISPDFSKRVAGGDILEIDLTSGMIKNITKKTVYHTQAFPDFLQEIVKAGGLINYVKKQRAV